MVIRRMNSVFTKHGRVLFGLITIVIIISFLGLMTPGQIFARDSGDAVVATVFGKDVTLQDIRDHARDTSIIYSLQYGWPMDSPQLQNMAQSSAYPELCQLAAAKQRGIRVSDKMIAEAISKYPTFLDPKTRKFDIKKYRKFVDNKLKPMDLQADDLDNAVRNRLILQQLSKQMMGDVIITEGELKEYFCMATEKFDVMTAKFTGIDFEKEVKLDEKKLQAYFKANSSKYVIPRKYEALIIEFPYSKYLPAAAAGVSAEQVKKYYEDNKAQFVDDKNKTLPFKKVMGTISKQLIQEATRKMATNAAQKFALEVYEKVMEEDADKKLSVFKKYVTDAKLSLVPSGEFTYPGGKIAGKWDEPELAKQISIVYSKAPVSNAVPGKNGAYIGYQTSLVKERPAKFEEVKAAVASDYRSEQAIRIAREKARSLYAKLLKAKPAARPAIVKAAKSPVFKPVSPFTMQRPPALPDGRQIAELAKKMQPMDVSKPIESINGSTLIFMVKRTMASEKEYEKSKQMVKYWYFQNKIRASQVAFSAWVDSKCKQVQAEK